MMESTHHENPREKLLAVANWLGWQEEDMSYGLRSADDAIKLYDYWDVRRDELPEMADEFVDDEGRYMAIFRKDALGYDPLGLLDACLEKRAEKIYRKSMKDASACLEDAFDAVRRRVYEEAETQLRKEYKIV